MTQSGETIGTLAQRCGVSPTAVHRWRTGKRVPRPVQMAVLTQVTGGLVTANDFSSASGFAEVQTAMEAPPPQHADIAVQAEARALGLDPDAIAARAIQDAIRAEKARRWQEENREALEAQNAWIEQHGLPLAKYRMF
jgi:antitoxin CcdA